MTVTTLETADRVLTIPTQAFFRETLRWHGALQRRDGCADAEDAAEECSALAEAGECATSPSAAQRCAHACGFCANGTAAVVAAWGLYPGGFILEAKKAGTSWWSKLTETKHPPNRILFLEPHQCSTPLGSFLQCHEECEAGGGCAAAGVEGAGCEAHCRAECVASVKAA